VTVNLPACPAPPTPGTSVQGARQGAQRAGAVGAGMSESGWMGGRKTGRDGVLSKGPRRCGIIQRVLSLPTC
jgi:hypothetical protein